MNWDGPIYFDPFAGGGGDFVPLIDPSLTPPVAWMGGKRKQAKHHHALLGLRPGKPPPMVLGDASWWGWVWPTLLDPEMGPEVCTMLRFWRDRDPRQLWFWLRDVGPMPSRVEAAAQLLWLQARAASGVPVWWEGGDVWQHTDYCGVQVARQGGISALRAAPGDGRERQLAVDRGSNGLRKWDRTRRGNEGPANQTHASDTPRLLQEASTQVDDAGQRNTRDPRTQAPALRQWAEGGGSRNACGKGFHDRGETLLASDGRGDPRESGQRTERLVANTRGGQLPGALFEAGHKGMDKRGGGGIVDTATVARRLDAIPARLVKASGGDAAFGKQDTWRAAQGWRVFQPTDVADRLDRLDRLRSCVTEDLVIYHCDAAELTEEWAPRAGAQARVLLDPPYDGATGYPATCARKEYLEIAATWARHGARIVLCEAEGLASSLGPGWKQTQIRAGKKPEWVTTYNCDPREMLPPLWRAMTAEAP